MLSVGYDRALRSTVIVVQVWFMVTYRSTSKFKIFSLNSCSLSCIEGDCNGKQILSSTKFPLRRNVFNSFMIK